MQRGRQLGVEIESVPIHFRETENFFRQILQIGVACMATNRERRRNSTFTLEVFELRIERRGRAMNP